MRSWADGPVTLALAALASTWTVIFWRAGLNCTPDSGYYLYFAARLHQQFDYSSGAAMYAPLFPAAIAASMSVAEFPGQAAVLVLGASLFCAMLGVYVAARIVATPWPVALIAALLLFVWPISADVYATIWSEGLLIGFLLAVAACFGLWLRTDRVFWLALTCVGTALAGLTKYVAAVVPPVLFVVGALTLWRARKLKCSVYLAAALAAAWVPVATALIYNRWRKGFWTGHPASHISISSNFLSLERTLVSQIAPEVWALCLVGVVALALRSSLPRLQSPDSVWWATLSTGLIALGYGAGLVLSASVVGVDKLEARLVSPIAPIILTFAVQSVGILCSATRALRWHLTLVAAAAGALLMSAALRTTRSHIVRLADLASDSRQRQTAAYHAGFGTSQTQRALNTFLESRLKSGSQVSFTFLELGSPVGRVYRDWYDMASALLRSPIRSNHYKLLSVTRDAVEIAPHGANSPDRILILVPALSEQKAFERRGRRLRRRQVEQLAEARTGDIMSRIADTIRKHGLREHLLFVSEQAGWFRVSSRKSWSGLLVVAESSLSGYAAYRLQADP